MPGCQGSFYEIKRIFEESERIDLDLNETADIVKRITEDETGPLQRSEQVAKQRKVAADCACEKECRSSCLIHPPLQRADFQMGIKRQINSNQLFVPFKIEDTFLKISVAHMSKPPEKMT